MNDSALARLQSHWVYGGALAGLLLLVLAPLLTSGLSRGGALVYLGLVVYMLHQYEEHDADRFRRFVNETVLKGQGNLSVSAVFVINLLGVWAVFAGALWATETVGRGWALVSGWFLLVNGLAHVIQAGIMRRGNPGVWTALVLFLPLGLYTLLAMVPLATWAENLLSLAVVLLLHAAIVLSVRKARP